MNAIEQLTIANNALSKLQAAYGDDLTWENLVDRTSKSILMLQQNARLLKLAERRLLILNDENSKLKEENIALKNNIEKTNVEEMWKRLFLLENDMIIFRKFGRIFSRLFFNIEKKL